MALAGSCCWAPTMSSCPIRWWSWSTAVSCAMRMRAPGKWSASMRRAVKRAPYPRSCPIHSAWPLRTINSTGPTGQRRCSKALHNMEILLVLLSLSLSLSFAARSWRAWTARACARSPYRRPSLAATSCTAWPPWSRTVRNTPASARSTTAAAPIHGSAWSTARHPPARAASAPAPLPAAPWPRPTPM